MNAGYDGGVLRLSAGWASTDRDADSLAATLITSVERARKAA